MVQPHYIPSHVISWRRWVRVCHVNGCPVNPLVQAGTDEVSVGENPVVTSTVSLETAFKEYQSYRLLLIFVITTVMPALLQSYGINTSCVYEMWLDVWL